MRNIELHAYNKTGESKRRLETAQVRAEGSLVISAAMLSARCPEDPGFCNGSDPMRLVLATILRIIDFRVVCDTDASFDVLTFSSDDPAGRSYDLACI